MSKLAELERRIERLERQMFPHENPQPFTPMVVGQAFYQCLTCGIKREAGKSYACPRPDCPTAARAVA